MRKTFVIFFLLICLIYLPSLPFTYPFAYSSSILLLFFFDFYVFNTLNTRIARNHDEITRLIYVFLRSPMGFEFCRD